MKRMIKHIINIFNSKSDKLSVLGDEIKKIHSLIPQDFGGGCSHIKALLMSFLVAEFKLQSTADIGVYRGRSLFPQVIAHKLYSKGIAFGIDPYSNVAAIQNDRPDLQLQLDEFVETTDFQKLFNDVSGIITNNDFQKNCILVRKKSSDAVLNLNEDGIKFGLVHIDGNHDTKFVMEDVNNYFPLLENKSFIVLDDISWDSVKPALNILAQQMILIDKLIDKSNDFALFGKGLSDSEIKMIKSIFKKIKK